MAEKNAFSIVPVIIALIAMGWIVTDTQNSGEHSWVNSYVNVTMSRVALETELSAKLDWFNCTETIIYISVVCKHLNQYSHCTRVCNFPVQMSLNSDQWKITFLSTFWTNCRPSLGASMLSVPLEKHGHSYVNWKWCTRNKSPVKRVCLVLFLMLSGDIQCNPGPGIPKCMVCENEIMENHQTLKCDGCDRWAHLNCEGNSSSYQVTQAKYLAWECPLCALPNVSNSFFSISDLNLSNSFSLLDSIDESNDELHPRTSSPKHANDKIHSSSRLNKQISIKVLIVNCRSLKSERKKLQFQELIATHNPDVICGQESHIDNTFTNGEIFPDRYNVSRKDRDVNGGGVFVAVSEKFVSTTEYHLDSACEIMWCKICLVGLKPLFIGSFYRPTNDKPDSLNGPYQSLNSLSKNGALPNIILGGDINLPSIKWTNHTINPNPQYGYRVNRLLLDITEEHALHQHVDKPTRGDNILDLLFSTYPDLVENVEVSSGMSDHSVVTAVISVNPKSKPKRPRKVFLFKKMDLNKMKKEASRFRDDFISERSALNSTNELWNEFTNKVNDLLHENVPMKLIREKWDVPWMTGSIKKLIRKKHRVYKTMQKYNTHENKTKFKNLQKTVQKMMQSSKNDYLMGLLLNTGSNDSKQAIKSTDHTNVSINKKFWTYIKSIKTNGSGVGTLSVDDQEISNAKEKAEALNRQYSSVFTNENITNMPCMDGEPYPTIDEVDIDVDGVEKLLKDINTNKASGPDGIPSRVLKDLSEELAAVITKVFSKSIETGELPDDWLTANVTAIFKKGKKYDPANYRPVALTSVTSKLMEHILYRHIITHLEKLNILSPFQHGFRANHSCESQLVITTEDLAKNLDNHLQTDVLILDFQKAFDKVPHQRLLSKLEFYGIRGNILKWITKWLTSRTQRVVVDGEISSPANVKSGVPQGTVLGPLMFLIYINDIADNISSETSIRLFADDCLLYRVIKSFSDTVTLQNDLTSLSNWAIKWQMSFNISKCKTLRITTKRNPIIQPYTMAGDELEAVNHHPYLGIELNHNLKWSEHIGNVTAKANRVLWFIRRNAGRCPTSVKQQMYFALVRPILEYASIVWDPHTKTDIQKLEMVQRRAARFVAGNYKRTEGTVTRIIENLGWPTLEQRRKEARQIAMFKIQHHEIAIPVPHYIHAQNINSQTRQYHPMKFRVLGPSTNVYKYSYFPRTILEWNGLPPSLLDSNKLDSFKTGLVNERN